MRLPCRRLFSAELPSHACRYDIEAELVKYKELAARLKPFVVDSIPILHEGLATSLHPPPSLCRSSPPPPALSSGKKIMVEGANALMLDIDFGTYPYVTSSSCGVGGASTGLGIPARFLTDVSGLHGTRALHAAQPLTGSRGVQSIHDKVSLAALCLLPQLHHSLQQSGLAKVLFHQSAWTLWARICKRHVGVRHSFHYSHSRRASRLGARWEPPRAAGAAAAGSTSLSSSAFPSHSALAAPPHPLCMYSTMINGYTRLNITKLDVLTGIPEIKVAVA